ESGQWHTAYSKSTFEEDVKGAIPTFKDRYLEKWSRPSDFALGHTLAFRIVTPWSAVSTPVQEKRYKGVTWLPSAPESMATEIDILITNPAAVVIGWPGKRSMGTSFIGSFLLSNGQVVWAVSLFVDMPDASNQLEGSNSQKGTNWFIKGKSEKDLLRLKDGGLRSFAFGTEPDGSRVIYDCAVEIRC
ncbi:MAG: hypothetical protein ACXV7G_12605, partial [Halobacteriota archaeon]